MKITFDESVLKACSLNEERELDWIEKVLGKNETPEEELTKVFSEQISKDIDEEIMKSIYIDTKFSTKYSTSQVMTQKNCIININNIVS